MKNMHKLETTHGFKYLDLFEKETDCTQFALKMKHSSNVLVRSQKSIICHSADNGKLIAFSCIYSFSYINFILLSLPTYRRSENAKLRV